MAMRNLIPSGRESRLPYLGSESDYGSLSSFRREMDRVFENFFGAPAIGRFGDFTELSTSWPKIDVENRAHEVVVTAEMPGMTDKDVELLVDNGTLTIRGEKKATKEEKGYSERLYGRFERQIPLPSSVDEQHCKADFHDGLLSIHLPKTREAEEARKKIPINSDTRH